MRASLEAIKALEKRDEEHFKSCLSFSLEKLKRLKLSYGFNILNGIPDTIQKIQAQLIPPFDTSPTSVQEILQEIIIAYETGEQQLKIYSQDAITLDPNSLNLHQRINLQEINKISSKYQFASQKNLLDYIYTNIPDRQCVISATCIKPQEYPQVIDKYGQAAILSSLSESSPDRQILAERIAHLKSQMLSLGTAVHHPARIRKEHPQIYESACQLYKRYAWALQSLIGKPQITEELKKEAYQLFLQSRASCISFLREHSLSKKSVSALLDNFTKFYESARGISVKLSTSDLEIKVEEFLKTRKILFRRQVQYRDVLPTNRNFWMDFLIPGESPAIIEVTSLDDPFIHTPTYWQNMNEKEKLAKTGNFQFHLIDDFCSIEKTLVVYEGIKQKPEEYPSQPTHTILPDKTPPRNSKQEIYFASSSHTNLPIIGKMKSSNWKGRPPIQH